MRLNQVSWMLLSCLPLVVGCAGGSALSTRMRVAQPVAIAADPAVATVVFVKPSDRVVAAGVVDVSGAVVGEVPGRSILVAKIPPGQHGFVKVMYKNAEAGDHSLFGHTLCNQILGNFAAGKLYFVELSVFRLFTVKPDHPHLAAWAAGQRVELAGEPPSVVGDPEWQPCVAQAAENSAKERKKGDSRSFVQPDDGLTAWPQ